MGDGLDILEALEAGPLMRKGSPAYKVARLRARTYRRMFAAIRRGSRRSAGQRLPTHLDLPDLFVSSLAFPELAADIREIMSDPASWADNDGPEAETDETERIFDDVVFFSPAYIEFCNQLFDLSGQPLEPSSTDAYAHGQMFSRMAWERNYPLGLAESVWPEKQALFDALCRNDARTVQACVEWILSMDVESEFGYLDMVRDGPEKAVAYGEALACRALLLSIVGVGEAPEYAAKTFTALAIDGEASFEFHEEPPLLDLLIYSDKAAPVWALVNALNDLGDVWRDCMEEHARHVLAAAEADGLDPLSPGGRRLLRNAIFPEIGGLDVLELEVSVCRHVNDWFRANCDDDFDMADIPPPDPTDDWRWMGLPDGLLAISDCLEQNSGRKVEACTLGEALKKVRLERPPAHVLRDARKNPRWRAWIDLFVGRDPQQGFYWAKWPIQQ